MYNIYERDYTGIKLPMVSSTKCPTCGMVFEAGKAYGYVCPENRCPIQPKVTC